ncbi:SAM hydroxide adenosyltransferase, partial [Methanohalophilus sp.]
GSHGFLEIAVNGGNAAQRLDIAGHPEIWIEK